MATDDGKVSSLLFGMAGILVWLQTLGNYPANLYAFTDDGLDFAND
jgi:hypothetical protein